MTTHPAPSPSRAVSATAVPATPAPAPEPVRVWRKGTQPAAGPTTSPADLRRDVDRVKRLARWMDARFNVLGIRVGLDSILGLIPVVGDTATSLVSLYPLHVARKHGLPQSVQLRIAGNVLADWAVGLVPLAGDLFDVAYKANLKNADLLERAAAGRAGPPTT